MTLVALSAALLLCLGVLLGATWTDLILRSKLRQQAEERRKLNAEWSALRAVQRKLVTCPRCASPLPTWHWSATSMDVEHPPDDDD